MANSKEMGASNTKDQLLDFRFMVKKWQKIFLDYKKNIYLWLQNATIKQITT